MNINCLIEQDVYTMKNIPFLKIITIILVLIRTKQVLSQTPIINSFSPQSGYVGIIVRIYGSYFRLDDQPVLASNQLNKPPINWTSVRFGDHQAIPTVVTSTYIEVPVPEIQVGLYKIWVLNANGGTESSTYFNVTPPPPPPVSNIAYLHGFGAGTNNSAWQYAQGLFNQEFITSHSTNTSYNGLASISLTASSMSASLVPYTNTVVVAHSMGGDLAREIKRQQSTNSNIRALITIGTPHTGAPITTQTQNNLGTVTSWWLGDIAMGWVAYGYNWDYAVYNIALPFLADLIDILNLFFDPFDLNSAAAQDLRPGSNFINTLNANPGATLPAANYAIYGQEDWYSHWRLADTKINGYETGDGLTSVLNLITYYSIYSYTCYDEADFYYYEFLSSGDPNDLDLYYYWNAVGDGFLYGAIALNQYHQQDWNTYLVGETIPAQQVYERNPINDAFIPTFSQAPSFIASDRKLIALHTNHLEETTNNESIAQISYALKRPDINLPLR